MIRTDLSFQLPPPWKGQTFSIARLGPVNFLVGPNGTGKSRFIRALQAELGGHARLLGTDRLTGMEQYRPLRDFFGDPFATGLPKNNFGQIKADGHQGSALDTIVLLEERPDLLIRVEATLAHLFDRDILLEWDSGHLVPMVRRTAGVSYRLDREECHGIKELLILLTHLYYDGHSHLIVDEPELNLHPQYQAFFMQEVRKQAGDPSADSNNKIILLVTHSPFIVDLRSEEDVRSIISFDLDHSVPVQVAQLTLPEPPRSFALTRRLNAHHKQFFFSDNPVFVEGVLDARLVEAILESSGNSAAGAGSCIIDAGGREEVNHYFELCRHLRKNAHFLYDLDSLFAGHLRACIRDDETVENFLASAGLGSDFAKYCGQLDQALTTCIDHLFTTPVCLSAGRLVTFLKGLGNRKSWNKPEHAKARTATLTALGLHRQDIVSITSESEVAAIEGRLRQIVSALREKNIHLLPGGTIERYLPAYSGDYYNPTDRKKQDAVTQELDYLGTPRSPAELEGRYGALYDAVQNLPSKVNVDVEPTVRRFLGRYIYELQQIATTHLESRHEYIVEQLNIVQPLMANVFTLTEFERTHGAEFAATIEVAETVVRGGRRVRVSHRTNAGMGDFELESR